MKIPKLTKREMVVIAGSLAVICISSLALLYRIFASSPGEAEALATPAVSPYQNLLDGTAEGAPSGTLPIVSVMIDNHPEARPQQAGLSEARVVYEVPVEGGLTRLMALFSGADLPARVGPVRSARPYFIGWAAEYGQPLYLHSGGSPEALRILNRAESGVSDMNEFAFGNYFWRDSQLARPHNLFTKGDFWKMWILTRSTTSSPWVDGWKFVRYAPEARTLIPSASVSSLAIPGKVTIPFNASYAVTWQYNASSSRFERVSPRGNEALISATTIIVQSTDVKTIDEEGRKEIAIVGGGPATIISQGLRLDGRWSKAAGGRTKFYTPSGDEAVFAPGAIWIHVVPVGTLLQIR